MKFEDLESTWALQQPATPAPIDLPRLQTALRAQLGRRQRLLLITGVCALLGLAVMQVIFFLGLRSVRLEEPGVAFARLLLHQGISLALLFEVVRAYRRHRQLVRGRAASVREVVQVSLAGVSGEMTDFRLGRWIVPVLLAHGLLSAYLNRPYYGGGLDGFALRAGLIFALYGLIGFIAWRHYRRVLQPRHDELTATLQQLEGEEEQRKKT